MSRQKIVLICGLACFTLLGLFPPWLGVLGNRSEYAVGFGLLFHAPPLGAKIDTVRLAVEWVCVFATTGAAWLLVGGAHRPKTSETVAANKEQPSAPAPKMKRESLFLAFTICLAVIAFFLVVWAMYRSHGVSTAEPTSAQRQDAIERPLGDYRPMH